MKKTVIMKKVYQAPEFTVCSITPCNLLAGTTTGSEIPGIDDDWSPGNLPEGWDIIEVEPGKVGTPD